MLICPSIFYRVLFFATFLDIKLSFNLTEGQAWLNADGSVCDFSERNGRNPCDSSVSIEIDGVLVHNSKQVENTDNPIFNDVFQTGWISPDTVIVISLRDRDYPMMSDGDKNHSDGPMSTWSGNAEYYLSRDLLVGNVTDGTHRNSLSISTKVVKTAEGKHIHQIISKLSLNKVIYGYNSG